MEMCITAYFVMGNLSSQNMEKQSTAFSHSANRVTHNSIKQPVIHIPTMLLRLLNPSLSFLLATYRHHRSVDKPPYIGNISDYHGML